MRATDSDIAWAAALLDRVAEDAFRLPDVPAAHRVDPMDDAEWVAWKPVLPSWGAEAVAQIESELHEALPPAYAAMLVARAMLDLDFGEYVFPSFHIDEELASVRAEIFGPWPCAEFGYVPFASARGCGDPVCFDVRRRKEDGDCPIVVFNHDFFSIIQPNREDWERYAAEVSPSFRLFFEQLVDGSLPQPPSSPAAVERARAWKEVDALLTALGLPKHHRPDGIAPTDPWAISRHLRAKLP